MPLVQSYDEIIEQIDTIDPVAYARTRNHLDGAVTKLSPYISRGVITLPQVRERLYVRHDPADCEKLVQELAWREYFQNVWWAKGEAIFSDLRFSRDDWAHEELPTALINASTGIAVMDTGIQGLYDTGYLHNHLRMALAAIACNCARAHWLPTGKWMYYHLADGDLASNFLSWQWVAGTSVNKRYSTNQELLNGISDTTQAGTWFDVSRDAFLTMTTPSHLGAYEPFSLTTPYPETQEPPSVAGQDVYCYTPWTLDPTWRRAQSARRLLLIDPAWFDRFPVSELVMDFIVRQGQTVMPELEIFIGDIFAVPGIDGAAHIYAKPHPTNQHWPATFDGRELLFPEVRGYYQSFFKYWQAVTTR